MFLVFDLSHFDFCEIYEYINYQRYSPLLYSHSPLPQSLIPVHEFFQVTPAIRADRFLFLTLPQALTLIVSLFIIRSFFSTNTYSKINKTYQFFQQNGKYCQRRNLLMQNRAAQSSSQHLRRGPL